jgi:hypothetical protein
LKPIPSLAASSYARFAASAHRFAYACPGGTQIVDSNDLHGGAVI